MNKNTEISTFDKDFLWHPYTQHATEKSPRIITRAKNASLFDDQGHEILDMISSWWTCAHGHSHPALNTAISRQLEQLDHIMFAGFTHPGAALLGKELAKLLPDSLNKTFFTDNGSTSIEVAIKMALQYWANIGEKGRTVFVAFEGGYHGDTVGAMSLGTGSGFFDNYKSLLSPAQLIPFPYTWEGDSTVLEKETVALEKAAALFQKYQGKIAALFFEPLMQGAAGIRMCRPEFINQVAALAQQHDILLVFDEVATGFGRTGTMFALEQTTVVPDIICLSKAITSGYMALAATVVKDKIYDAFLGKDFSTALSHGHSFTANPIACSVALKSLELFREENTLDRISAIETQHQDFLKTVQEHPRVDSARSLGTILAFNLRGGKTGYRTKDGIFLRDWYLEHGLNIRPLGSSVYIIPPYCITQNELSKAYEGILAGLDAL